MDTGADGGDAAAAGRGTSRDAATAHRERQRRALRTHGRAVRAAMGAEQRATAARVAIGRLATHGALTRADGVVLTAAVGDELDLAPLVPALRARGTRVALPRVVGDDLVAVELCEDTVVVPGWRGVPEPVGPPVDLEQGRWVVLVPGLAFDRAGNRLGYGGGHFDRFLTAHPGLVPVGVCFAGQLVADVPTEPHDVRVHDVVVG